MELGLDGQKTREFVDALVHAFPNRNDLVQMIRYGINENLNVITTAQNLRHDALALVEWAEARGRTDEVLLAARNENPGNSLLRQFAEQFELAASSGALEALVLETVRFENPEEWRKLMSQSELAVCRVETPMSMGTGFLVGPDLIMTNNHVIEGIIKEPSLRDQVMLRFDYKMSPDGRILKTGKVYKLTAKADWLLDNSPSAKLDYALLRTDSTPGQDPVGDQQTAPKRGWLMPQSHNFEVGEPLFIIQHPEAKPLKLAIGYVVAVKPALKRIVYTANTLEGSSGSPCFTSDWRLVGLHHYGNPEGNEGVMFSDIMAQPKVHQVLNSVAPAPTLA